MPRERQPSLSLSASGGTPSPFSVQRSKRPSGIKSALSSLFGKKPAAAKPPMTPVLTAPSPLFIDTGVPPRLDGGIVDSSPRNFDVAQAPQAIVVQGRRGTADRAALASAAAAVGGAAVPPSPRHSSGVSGLQSLELRDAERRGSALLGLLPSASAVPEVAVPAGICCWRSVKRPGSETCDCPRCVSLELVVPTAAAAAVLQHKDLTQRPMWGMKASGWHWSLPGLAVFSPEELFALPARRALALSVFLDAARRLDQEVSKDVWIVDLVKQSQVVMVKDWRRWDWHMIAWLLDGPLTNQDVLTDAISRTRFMHRLGKLFCLRSSKHAVSYVARAALQCGVGSLWVNLWCSRAGVQAHRPAAVVCCQPPLCPSCAPVAVAVPPPPPGPHASGTGRVRVFTRSGRPALCRNERAVTYLCVPSPSRPVCAARV